MQLLNPREVHYFAGKVYGLDVELQSLAVVESPTAKRRMEASVADRYKSDIKREASISFADFKTFTSRSGLFSINRLSGFGFIAEGVGPRAGEWILATRGTDFEYNKYDLATDANVGIDIGPKGHIVHRGFSKTFKGYESQLLSFIRAHGLVRPRVIHCVGHSLGGALANLNAMLLQQRGFNVALYTIGAPRVGYLDFMADLIGTLPVNQIKRVAHAADPVPMVPVYPFVHASRARSELMMPGVAGSISINNHLLDGGYAPMARMKSWSELLNPEQFEMSARRMVKDFNSLGGASHYSAALMLNITQAILDAAEILGVVTLSLIQTGLSVAITLFDILAELLAKAWHLGGEMMTTLQNIANAMRRFLGKPALPDSAKMDQATFRGLLAQFTTEVGGMANMAMLRAARA